MATTVESSSGTGDRRKPSRLQRRAPASIQINRVPDWNVAIPLLSPLVVSPVDRTVELKSKDEPKQEHQHQHQHQFQHQQQTADAEKPVFKKWQHPAFCYDSTSATTSFMPSFVPV